MEKPYLEMYKLQLIELYRGKDSFRCFVICDVYGIISSSIWMILKYFIEHIIFNDVSMCTVIHTVDLHRYI